LAIRTPLELIGTSQLVMPASALAAAAAAAAICRRVDRTTMSTGVNTAWRPAQYVVRAASHRIQSRSFTYLPNVNVKKTVVNGDVQ